MILQLRRFIEEGTSQGLEVTSADEKDGSQAIAKQSAHRITADTVSDRRPCGPPYEVWDAQRFGNGTNHGKYSEEPKSAKWERQITPTFLLAKRASAHGFCSCLSGASWTDKTTCDSNQIHLDTRCYLSANHAQAFLSYTSWKVK